MQTPRDRIRRAMNRQFSQEVPPSDDILVVTVLCQGTSIPHISLPFSLARKISGKTNILSVRPHLKQKARRKGRDDIVVPAYKSNLSPRWH
eukprot:scaffold259909_cov19-Tisochrysis_lutea.AAC.1